jgi:hypothetical protein
MLYALIVELAALAPGHPVPTAGMQDITPYYIRYAAVLCTMQLFESLGAMFLLVFISGLATHLRRLEGRTSVLTTAAVTAGVTVASLSLITSAATLSIVLNAGRMQGSGVLQWLHDFVNATDVVMSLPLAVVVASISGILVRGQHLIHWIGLAGLAVAGLLAFRSLAVVGAPVLPFPPLYPAWFEALAIVLAVRALSFQRGGGWRARSA